MTFIEERDGVCYEFEYGAGCDDCFGLGADFHHEPSCDSDFCVGSGDEHSCNGSWLPCPTCGSMKPLPRSKQGAMSE